MKARARLFVMGLLAFSLWHSGAGAYPFRAQSFCEVSGADGLEGPLFRFSIVAEPGNTTGLSEADLEAIRHEVRVAGKSIPAEDVVVVPPGQEKAGGRTRALRFLVLLDVSASMCYPADSSQYDLSRFHCKGFTGKRKLDEAMGSLQDFLEALQKVDGVEVAFTTFANQFTRKDDFRYLKPADALQQLRSSWKEINTRWEEQGDLKPFYATPLYNAVAEAYQNVTGASAKDADAKLERSYVMVVISDGDNDLSYKGTRVDGFDDPKVGSQLPWGWMWSTDTISGADDQPPGVTARPRTHEFLSLLRDGQRDRRFSLYALGFGTLDNGQLLEDKLKEFVKDPQNGQGDATHYIAAPGGDALSRTLLEVAKMHTEAVDVSVMVAGQIRPELADQSVEIALRGGAVEPVTIPQVAYTQLTPECAPSPAELVRWPGLTGSWGARLTIYFAGLLVLLPLWLLPRLFARRYDVPPVQSPPAADPGRHTRVRLLAQGDGRAEHRAQQPPRI